MPYTLEGRNVLITGGSRGLGAVIAHKFAAAGSNIAINYANNGKAARDLADSLEKDYGVNAVVVKADAGSMHDCEQCVKKTIDLLGGLDIIVANAGYTKFSEFGDLNALGEDDWDKCWAVNVKGPLALLRAAMPTFNANPEGGAFIITSSIAGNSIGGSSMPYSVTKAAQQHLMKCMASTQGAKVRVNAVLPGLLLTEWGLSYGDERIAALKDRAALKIETKLEDCADVYLMLARNTSLTGQNIQVDAGLNIANM